jgi:hypothetical protein
LKKTNYFFLFFILIIAGLGAYAQQTEPVKTIKIKKDKLFAKAAFDDTEFKVIAFDRYGNPHQEAIKSFTIYYKEGKHEFQNPVVGNVFPQKTINFLTKKKKFATKICLTNLIAEDKEGHLEELPDLCDIIIFPDCKKVNKTN